MAEGCEHELQTVWKDPKIEPALEALVKLSGKQSVLGKQGMHRTSMTRPSLQEILQGLLSGQNAGK